MDKAVFSTYVEDKERITWASRGSKVDLIKSPFEPSIASAETKFLVIGEGEEVEKSSSYTTPVGRSKDNVRV